MNILGRYPKKREIQRALPTPSEWLQNDFLVRRQEGTDWKSLYKLQHNWANGSCSISAMKVADGPVDSPVLVRMHEDTIVVVGVVMGIRAWSTQGGSNPLASMSIITGSTPSTGSPIPVSLAISPGRVGQTPCISVAIGFDDGTFSVYELDLVRAKFSRCCGHRLVQQMAITDLAISGSYLATLTEIRLLSLFRLHRRPYSPEEVDQIRPELLCSLESQTTWSPATLSLQSRAHVVSVSIAYVVPRHRSGWSVGVQELEFAKDGKMTKSRMATAIQQGMFPQSLVSIFAAAMSPGLIISSPLPLSSRPTSISYNHPYLVTAHSDNTLTLYTVRSTDAKLRVGYGTRLWGHTSAVSAVHVNSRGKAVSVTSRGDDVRVWDLEGGVDARTTLQRMGQGELCVRIQPEMDNHRPDVANSIPEDQGGNASMSMAIDSSGIAFNAPLAPAAETAWIHFNEQKMFLSRRQGPGSEALIVYDFT